MGIWSFQPSKISAKNYMAIFFFRGSSYIVFFVNIPFLSNSRNVSVYELTIRTWNMMWWTWRGRISKKHREGWKWYENSQGKNIAIKIEWREHITYILLLFWIQTRTHVFELKKTIRIVLWLINSHLSSQCYGMKTSMSFPHRKEFIDPGTYRNSGVVSYQKWMKMDSGECKNYPNSYESKYTSDKLIQFKLQTFVFFSKSTFNANNSIFKRKSWIMTKTTFWSTIQ